MKKILLKSMMLLCLLFVGMGAWADVVEVSSFDAISGDLNSYISYEAAKGTAATAPAVNSNEIRVYQGGGLFTVTPKNGATITEIVLGSSMATKVTYAVDGGSASSNQSIAADGTVTVGSINATQNVVFTCTGTDKNSRLYVNYLKVTYTVPVAKPFTVTFNAGINGTCSTTSLTESSVGAGVTLPAVTPNTGYDFVGWSTDATPSSANAGAAGATYNPLSDCTLYAYYIVARPTGEVFYESFDTNDGTGGNDGQWSGSIASSKFNSDNSWAVVSASGANHCAKFGTGSALGSATTPAIAASGKFTLTFKAAAWNGNQESTTLKLSATGATLSVSSVTLTKGAWNTYVVNITNATEGFTIKFAGNAASNSRFFLDEVSIVEVSTATITLNPACTDDVFVYGTYSNTSSWVVPGNLFVSEVMVVGNEIDFEDAMYDEGDIVPANTGVLVYAEQGGNYEVELSNEAGTSILGNNNALRGTGNGITSEQMAAVDAGKEYFRLTMHNGTDCGFWWGAADGAAFALGANKAYLVADAAAAKGFRFGKDATGIKTVNAEKVANAKFIENGRVVIVKDGAKYNVAGQVIK